MHEAEAASIREVGRLPGVRSVGVGGSPMGLLPRLSGVTLPGDSREFPPIAMQPISVGYLETLTARLMGGRLFTVDDRRGSPTVVILSVSAARILWGSANLVGQTIVLPATGPVRVVGVVADMAARGLETKSAEIFIPHLQSPYVAGGTMLVKAASDPTNIVPAIKAIVRRVNPEQPFPEVVSLADQVDRTLATRRFVLQIVGIFSLLGLALAMIGVYGVVAESQAQRVAEFGVRIALGAGTADLLALVLRQGALILAVGLAFGVFGAGLLRHYMDTIVFGVGTLDLLSYLAACAALVLVASAACAVPARRAARIDPASALKME
jgi:putative ABC transport system permease protein